MIKLIFDLFSSYQKCYSAKGKRLENTGNLVAITTIRINHCTGYITNSNNTMPTISDIGRALISRIMQMQAMANGRLNIQSQIERFDSHSGKPAGSITNTKSLLINSWIAIANSPTAKNRRHILVVFSIKVNWFLKIDWITCLFNRFWKKVCFVYYCIIKVMVFHLFEPSC